MMPLYEAKMIHLYDTKWATYEPDGAVRDVTAAEKRNPNFHVMPRYWVHSDEVDKKLAGRWDKPWFLGWRWVTNTTNERTLVAALLPRVAAGNSLPIALHAGDRALLASAWSSMCMDFATRQKLGGVNLTFTTISQLPVPNPEVLSKHAAVIADRVDRLSSQRLVDDTAAQLRAELDALMFHVYGVARDDVDYILETFPIVKRKDVATHGEYRTKNLILHAYDRMAAS